MIDFTGTPAYHKASIAKGTSKLIKDIERLIEFNPRITITLDNKDYNMLISYLSNDYQQLANDSMQFFNATIKPIRTNK